MKKILGLFLLFTAFSTEAYCAEELNYNCTALKLVYENGRPVRFDELANLKGSYPIVPFETSSKYSGKPVTLQLSYPVTNFTAAFGGTTYKVNNVLSVILTRPQRFSNEWGVCQFNSNLTGNILNDAKQVPVTSASIGTTKVVKDVINCNGMTVQTNDEFSLGHTQTRLDNDNENLVYSCAYKIVNVRTKSVKLVK